MRALSLFLAHAACLGGLLACSGEQEPSTPTQAAAAAAAEAPLPETAPAAAPAAPATSPATSSAKPVADESPAERGRRVYLANCTACHNADPKLDGPLGPAIVGSTQELITVRVMRAGYPAGHTPKRDTNLMMPLPYLEADIPALTAFLAEASPATAIE